MRNADPKDDTVTTQPEDAKRGQNEPLNPLQPAIALLGGMYQRIEEGPMPTDLKNISLRVLQDSTEAVYSTLEITERLVLKNVHDWMADRGPAAAAKQLDASFAEYLTSRFPDQL